MPLLALPYWMQAVPVPSIASRAEADPVGRPSALSQSGWQIRYTEYADASSDAADVTTGFRSKYRFDMWTAKTPCGFRCRKKS